LQKWQRGLHINSNNAIASRATMALQWWERHLRINDDNNLIVMMATVPAWGQQWQHCGKGNNYVADQGQWCHCYKSNDSSLTMARVPVHQQQQRRHCHESDNRNCSNSKDPYALLATMPSQHGQQCHCNDGKNTCALMMTMTPLQQGQQH
jgi:hypothetical protein